MSEEIKRIQNHYDARLHKFNKHYCRLNKVVNLVYQERQRAILKLFSKNNISDLKNMKILEVGCGSGVNILEFLFLGATPKNITGNELLKNRYDTAKNVLPSDIDLIHGNAADLNLPEESFDIILQSLVLSSVIDPLIQQNIADQIWRFLKRDGAILWYDFIYNNPANKNVRGIPISKIRKLFPNAKIDILKVFLAPPIARRIPSFLYPYLNFSF